MSEKSVQQPSYKILAVVGGVDILTNDDGTYIYFQSDLDVCNDGSGPAHGDQYHQAQTAYYNGGKFLNADKDKYIVVPPQIRSMVGPVVMGCMGKVTHLKTGKSSVGVVGDIGPNDKTGECAYCLAFALNPAIGHNHGDTQRHYIYELWPGTPAIVDGKAYKLEPA
jgi:hypothetical protein